MNDLLMQYKELTLQQLQFISLDNYEESIRLAEEKSCLFLKIQQELQLTSKERQNIPQLEKQLAEEIIMLNEKAVKLMENYKLQISNELNKLKMSRQVQGIYGTTYSDNAYFFDRTK